MVTTIYKQVAQVLGTAAAPNYANIFMDRFETRALSNWLLKPLLWLRFIDDIFMILTHGEDKLQEFITYLNGIHPTIKFTHEFSQTHLNFLNTTVKVDKEKEVYTCTYIIHLHTIPQAKQKGHMDNS